MNKLGADVEGKIHPARRARREHGLEREQIGLDRRARPRGSSWCTRLRHHRVQIFARVPDAVMHRAIEVVVAPAADPVSVSGVMLGELSEPKGVPICRPPAKACRPAACDKACSPPRALCTRREPRYRLLRPPVRRWLPPSAVRSGRRHAGEATWRDPFALRFPITASLA